MTYFSLFVTDMEPNQVLMPFDKASGYLKLEFHSHHHLAMQTRYTPLENVTDH